MRQVLQSVTIVETNLFLDLQRFGTHGNISWVALKSVESYTMLFKLSLSWLTLLLI